VHLGCPPKYSPATYTQVYEGPCQPGAKVQWGYMTWVAGTPGDSNVVFNARTADTQALLAAETFVPVATAHALPNNQVCPMTGVTGCPIDLYQTLGNPAARRQFFELQIILNPSSDFTQAPSLDNYQISYSCAPSE